MNYKNIFKIRPLSILLVIIIYWLLWSYHLKCRPFYLMGGAISEDGSVGGGLIRPCGSFSQWLWDNEKILSLYNKINDWHIL